MKLPENYPPWFAEIANKHCGKEKILELVKGQQEHIRKIVAEKTDRIMPILHVYGITVDETKEVQDCEPESAIFGIAGFGSPQEKDAILEGIAQMLVQKRMTPFAVAFLCEAWVSTISPKNRVYHRTIKAPSNDPNRKEGITIAALSMLRIGAQTAAMITRDKDNNIVLADFSKIEVHDPDEGNLALHRFYHAYSTLLGKKLGVERKQ